MKGKAPALESVRKGRIRTISELLIGSSSLTLTGGGTVSMGNSANNYIFGSPNTGTLTNKNNTIQGSGNIGNNQLTLAGHALQKVVLCSAN